MPAAEEQKGPTEEVKEAVRQKVRPLRRRCSQAVAGGRRIQSSAGEQLLGAGRNPQQANSSEEQQATQN
jgi:hypothetical protein